MQVAVAYLGLAQEPHETTNQSSPDDDPPLKRGWLPPSSWFNLSVLTSRLGKSRHGRQLIIHIIQTSCHDCIEHISIALSS